MKNNFRAQKEEAALMIAEGRYDYQQIAEKLGVTDRTLRNWRKSKKFEERVEFHSADLAARAQKRGIARQDYRLKCLADRHSAIQQVIEERAKDHDMADVPGGKTGLVCRKVVASAGQIVGVEYAIDTGALRELSNIETQAAKELGQLIDRTESKVDATVTERKLSDDELERLFNDALRRARVAAASSEGGETESSSAADGENPSTEPENVQEQPS